MNERDVVYVSDILDAADKIAVVVARGRRRFDSDWEQRDVAERRLEILGEAASRLSDQFQAEHPTLPIRKAKALRNVIAHEYGDIDYDELWQVVKADVPEFAAALRSILEQRGNADPGAADG